MRGLLTVVVLAALGLAGCGEKPSSSPSTSPPAPQRPVSLVYDFGDGQPNPVDESAGPLQPPWPKDVPAACGERLADPKLMVMLRRTVVRISRRVPGGRGARGQDSGSGVVIAPSGQILTAAHVARLGKEWHVEWDDGRTELADVKNVDESSDIARLEIRAPVDARFPYLRVARREYYTESTVEGRPVMAAGYSLENGRFLLAATCATFNRIARWPQLTGMTGLEAKWSQQAPVHVFSGDAPRGFSGGPVVDANAVVVSLACYRTRASKPGVETVFVGNRPSDFLEKIGLR